MGLLRRESREEAEQRQMDTGALVSKGYRPYQARSQDGQETWEVWAKGKAVVDLLLDTDNRSTYRIDMHRGFRASSNSIILREDDWGHTEIVDHYHTR